MKNQRAVLMLGLAVVLGLGAVLLASSWLQKQSPAVAGRIVVAATDASPGQRLAPDMVKLAEWPVESVPPGALRELRKLDGRVLRHAVQRGEPLSEGKLAPAGASGGLSALIAEGKRAITVRVNDVVGVAGFALPGNFVDVLVYTQLDAQSRHAQRAISKIVLERILVLAVAQEVGRDDTKPRVVNAVTLEVTPVQAEQLDLARSVGTLSLVLRNQVDPQPGVTEGATKVSLLGIADEAPAAPPAVASAPQPPPRPRAAPAAADVRHCVAVIDGVHRGQECY